MRAVAVAVSVMFLLMPHPATGQTPIASSDAGHKRRDRVSLQAAAGHTVLDPASTLSAALGYSPGSRVELLLNVERLHLPFQLTNYPDGGYSVSRGAKMTFVSGELRVALTPPKRVTPFVLVGAGGGISRPNVNAYFPNPVRNDLRVMYGGGGVRVPMRGGLSFVGDTRAMLGLEGYDSVMCAWSARAAVAWRF